MPVPASNSKAYSANTHASANKKWKSGSICSSPASNTSPKSPFPAGNAINNCAARLLILNATDYASVNLNRCNLLRTQQTDCGYLPLIGDNFAKQIGTVGENKRTTSWACYY